MMALGETGGAVSACPQPWGLSLMLTLTSFDTGGVGFGVNYYPRKAETKVY